MDRSSATTLERYAFRLFVAVPLLTLAYMSVTILYLGVDVPAWDDWRQYRQGKAGAFDLAYLFEASNSTVYSVGKVLDSLAVHTLDGNAIAYKFLSMIAVLGSLLWLQWKLLSRALDDRFLVACCFAVTMFMLCPDSYWDLQYMAFHQAIPLVCLLASLLVITAVRFKAGWKVGLLFGLGLIAGLSYISGAVAMSVTAITLLLLGWRSTEHRRQFLPAAVALGFAGLITSCLQAWGVLTAQGGKFHHPDAPLATPLSVDFWMYALGKVARSLQLPRHPLEMSFVVAVLSVAVLGWTAYLAWRSIDDVRPSDAREKQRASVTLCLIAAIAAYLAMVSAGRALFQRGAPAGLLDAFLVGFPRFHFFWITLLWPWVLAALLAELSRRTSSTSVRLVASVTALLVFVWVALSGGLDHRASIQATSLKLQRGMQCLQESLLTSATIACLDLYPGDITEGYDYAVITGASFVRSAPPTLRKHNPSPRFVLFELADQTVSRLVVRNAAATVEPGPHLALLADSDPQIVLSTGAPDRMKKCYMLSVGAKIRADQKDTALLFYLPAGVRFFSEINSKRVDFGPGSDANFIVVSPVGFEDMIRLDPATTAGALTLETLDVRCLAYLR